MAVVRRRDAGHRKATQQGQRVRGVVGVRDGPDVAVELVEQRQRQVGRQVDQRAVDGLLDRLVLVERGAPHERQQARVHLPAHRQEAEHLHAPPHQLVVQRLPEDELDHPLPQDPMHKLLRGGGAPVGLLLALGALALHPLHRLQVLLLAQQQRDHLLDLGEAVQPLLEVRGAQALERQRLPQSVQDEHGVREPGVVEEHVEALMQVAHRLAVLQLEHLVGEGRHVKSERRLHPPRVRLQNRLLQNLLHLEQRSDEHLHGGEVEQWRQGDPRDQRVEPAHRVKVLDVPDVVVRHVLTRREALARPLLISAVIVRRGAVVARIGAERLLRRHTAACFRPAAFARLPAGARPLARANAASQRACCNRSG
eukprot:scaffold270_cov121-Isochrysis_galbana.AAC.27